MARLKYVIGFLVVIVLCTVIWFEHPAKEQANQLDEKASALEEQANQLDKKVSALEEQIGRHYLADISSLENTAEQLLAHNFNQPITDEDEGLIDELSEGFLDTSDNIFYMNRDEPIHLEWQGRLLDVHMYLLRYLSGTSLTKEEVADLYQALQATRFIAMDFGGIAQDDPQSSYDAMHDEEHEIVERIKYRLSLNY